MLLYWIVSGLIILTYCVGAALWINWEDVSESWSARPRTARRRAQDADRKVQLAYHQARRQMNEAAGQHWRNMAG